MPDGGIGIRRYGDTGMRGCAGGLLKESPRPPRTFLERIIIGGSRRSRPVPAFACALAWRRGLSLSLWCPRGACPGRHWLALPRGRGPSQTPPSLATDSSISPGPPSPWLPALLIGKRFCRCCAGLEIPKAHPRRVQDWQGEPVPRGFSPRGCKGRSPLHMKSKNLPLPAGKGGGGMGAESKLKAG